VDVAGGFGVLVPGVDPGVELGDDGEFGDVGFELGEVLVPGFTGVVFGVVFGVEFGVVSGVEPGVAFGLVEFGVLAPGVPGVCAVGGFTGGVLV